jgi:5-(carboxyamino)imidazole ribonucleotide synthase
MSRILLPGATLGVLGSGQLGRMFTLAARRLGYRVHVLSPDDDTPTGQVADVEINAPFDDLEAVANFARQVDVVTFEFENVPSETTETAGRYAPVRPGAHVLHISQNRLREKSFLAAAALPVTPFAAVGSQQELEAAITRLGLPAVLKTADWGYDGKGQRMIRAAEEAIPAWKSLGEGPAILEQFIPFESELSIVGARSLDGQFVHYGPIANSHVNHILDLSVFPAPVSPRVAQDAVEIARAVFEKLDVVGVLCVEFFLTLDERLLINELAPRPHNSGHLTIDGHVTCQFEQQVRAVCGLPLGSSRWLSASAMANLLGDLWQNGPLDWLAVCACDDVKFHLYGKREARVGRKMGHLSALGDTGAAAAERVLDARRRLAGG